MSQGRPVPVSRLRPTTGRLQALWFDSDARRVVKSVALAGKKRQSGRRLVEVTRGKSDLWIEIGSSRHSSPGWISTDIDFAANYYLDATKPWPVAAGSVAFVLADNVIEHLPLDANRQLFLHARRALKAGGVLRLATPDIERIAAIYSAGGGAVQDALLEQRSRGYVAEHAPDLLRIAFVEHGHYAGYLFDEASLTAELDAAGFTNIARQPLGVSSHVPLNGLETRAGLEKDIQLVMEATAA